MAYSIVSVNEVNANQPNDIGLGISFGSTNDTIFSPIYASAAQTKENLKTLLLTRIGERYMQPSYGTNLLNVIFQPNLSSIKSEVRTLISEPVHHWLPYISLDSIDVVTNEDDPTLDHDIKITINYSINEFSPDTITFTVDNSTVAVQ
jgi:phage baseplate assembly protein W